MNLDHCNQNNPPAIATTVIVNGLQLLNLLLPHAGGISGQQTQNNSWQSHRWPDGVVATFPKN
jgi:hypothetical protein